MSKALLTLHDVIGETPLGQLGHDRPINLTLDEGDVAVIFGGKETSSLFRLIMGLGKIASGRIELLNDAKIDATSSPEELVAFRQKIGFGFRDKGLLSNLSLLDNVDLPAKYHGRYGKAKKSGSYAEAALTELGVDRSFWQMRPNRISWETRKKVLLARSIVLGAKVLILDDPSIMAASPMVLDLIRWIRGRRELGNAVLVGTNDFPFGIAVADWVLHPKTREPVRRYDDFVDSTWIKSAALLTERISA